MRSFNTAGPVNAADHYLIAPLSRIDLDEALGMVRDKKYFVLHAPRQTGKTSALLALAELLNGRGYRCVYVTFETARTARDDVQRAMRTVLVRLASQARATLDDGFLDDIWPDVLARVGADEALGEVLSRWAQASPGPLVLLIDEIDTLTGDSLLSVLQQIRAGYPGRPERFPHSVVLCGMRDPRDYRMGAAGSPFNIAAKSLRLGDFTREQTLALLGQHTEETGQAFAPEALEAVWTQTRGQPWLVNALAYGACFENRALREDRSRTVTANDIAAVREDLIVNRVTHLDYLADKLREDRVRRVIEPMLSGTHGHAFTDRDISYARDLGLVAGDAPLRVANPIYAEVLPRELAWVAQETLDLSPPRYVRTDGSLDAGLLMEEFQAFFRRHSEHWQNRFAYAEAWPQLLLQAYLQRVVNGGGRIEREYALGRGRVDLLIVWPVADRVQEFVVECKVVRERDSLESVVDEGVEQTAGYVDRCAAEAGHLVVIDRRENRSWDEKVFHRRRRSQPVAIDVWGM
ncbi:MAG: AAA-like domain-containing protein [Spirochaetaceae bacterium]|nr:AAA-like domain-containing protein [Spirochaetaceae bacterium]